MISPVNKQNQQTNKIQQLVVVVWLLACWVVLVDTDRVVPVQTTVQCSSNHNHKTTQLTGSCLIKMVHFVGTPLLLSLCESGSMTCMQLHDSLFISVQNDTECIITIHAHLWQ